MWPLPPVWGCCQALWHPRPWVMDPVWFGLLVFSPTHAALRPLRKLPECSQQQTAIGSLGLPLRGRSSAIGPPAALARLTPLCSFSQAPPGPAPTPSLPWLYYSPLPHPDALLLPSQPKIPYLLPDLADQERFRSLRDWRPHPFCAFLTEL